MLTPSVCTFQIFTELPNDLQNRSWLAVSCYLVKHGADVGCSNSSNVTPLDLLSEHAAMTDILLTYMDVYDNQLLCNYFMKFRSMADAVHLGFVFFQHFPMKTVEWHLAGVSHRCYALCYYGLVRSSQIVRVTRSWTSIVYPYHSDLLRWTPGSGVLKLQWYTVVGWNVACSIHCRPVWAT